MSTFLQSQNTKRIHSAEDLKLYFQSFTKSLSQKLVGIECELLGVHGKTGEALPYSGENGIESVLNNLAYEFGYEKIVEDDHTIALRQGTTLIGLEPGGQIELSAGPVANIHQVKKQLDQFFFELKTIKQFLKEVDFLAYGIQPFSSAPSINWVPKKRYAIMAKYLRKCGHLSHDMMKRTASNQVSIDYLSEEDAFQKMCLAMRLTPIVYALFAHSSFSKGKPSGCVSERLHIWHYTDRVRSGLLIRALCPEPSFQNYLQYLLELPMMFIVRHGKWIQIPNMTFEKFLEKGYQGIRATLEDFELHLSTVFTEARFKQYLEIRSADGQRRHLIPSVAAFWKGILYDEPARRAASALVKRWKEEDFIGLYSQVETKGLRAKVRGTSVLELARELVRISEKGLQDQPEFNEEEQDERIYLEPLKEEVLKRGQTQGEQLVHLWEGSFRKDRRALIRYLSVT